MILKDFISYQQQQEILNWSKTLVLTNEPNFTSIVDIPYEPRCLTEIRTKCLNASTGITYLNSIIAPFVLGVPVGSNINTHVDGTCNITFEGVAGNYNHVRFVILIQKPDVGGKLISDGNIIDLEEGDCFILDTSLEHSLSKVEGLKDYFALAFPFEIKIN